MSEGEYLDELIRKGQPVLFQLSEGRDISAIPVSHDGAAIVIKNAHTGNTMLIYKKAVSVITPVGG